MNLDIITSKQVTKCLISEEPVFKILDLGQHPYADTFINDTQFNLSEPVFPLQVYLQPDSGSIQLGYISHDKDRYNLYKYSYTSSNSKTSRDHWDEYASTVKEQFPAAKFIVEIGSNDGYLVNQFRKDGIKTLGIDSSEEMCNMAKELGVETIPCLFDISVSQDLVKQYGRCDIIMANNVFNHANDPVSFARAVSTLLDKNGVFIFEVPYWLSMIESGRFPDMIYHEHPSYFTIKMASNILESVGMSISKFEIVDYHGGSIRVFAKHTNASTSLSVKEAIIKEKEVRLFDINFYSQLQKKLEKQRDQWLFNFYKIKVEDPEAVFIGVGAAAKANTWLTWHGINKTHLEYITDSSSFKQGKYTPLSRIPITSDNIFSEYKNPYALILSWNIGEGLRRAILNINPNTKFLQQ